LIARRILLAVIERDEPHRSVPSLQRPAEKAIGEPGVLRKARAVAVGADDLALHRALGLVLAVVPVPDDDRAQRLRVRSAIGAAAVVLESDKLAVGRVGDEI